MYCVLGLFKQLIKSAMNIGSDQKAALFNELVTFLQGKQFSKADKFLDAHPEMMKMKDASERMVVHYAASTGHLELVQRVLGAQPELADLVDDSGWTPLLIAASSGHLEVVRHLFNLQVDVNHRNSTGQSALHYVCSKNHQGIAQVLIDNGADLNAQDERGATPLHRAAGRGHVRMVNLLMGYRKQLQIDLTNQEGDTPLHLACEDDQQDVALFLVRSGANLEKENRENKTPLDMIKSSNFRQQIVKARESVQPTAGT